ncbi:uncharacterized protein LOC6047067 [Culex quinquefasciatus]|uniref:uncharacterized protein LOC6047067 n=1 Tax=Culex quinquefasciatus TaxID=7176 RepID=UPI0018E2BC64|nr:uncharacterized protein LOC6047067 [Culex quinquefasciatus]
MLILNTNKLDVRILGSVYPDKAPMVQDYRYIQWKTIDAAHHPPDTVNRFQTEHLNARSVQFTWSRFIATDAINRCLMPRRRHPRRLDPGQLSEHFGGCDALQPGGFAFVYAVQCVPPAPCWTKQNVPGH